MNFKKIMVIDDDSSDQFLSKILIKKFDSQIEIIEAYDGQNALELLDTMDQAPDIIFLDINMPVMNGHEFLKAYNEKVNQPTVIIMLTSSDQDIDKEKSMGYSFVKDYFTKPLNEELIKRAAQFTL